MNLVERRKKLIIFMTLCLIILGLFIAITTKSTKTKAATCPVCAGNPTLNSATCTTPAKCSRCGYETGSALGHNWGAWSSSGTSTHTRKCSRCNATTSAGCTWEDATCTTPKTCSVCKQTTGSALGHNWGELTNTNSTYHKNTCTICGESKNEGHTYTTWVKTSTVHYKKCDCGAQNSSTSGQHTFEDLYVITQPTATKYGVKKVRCTVCDYTVGIVLTPTGSSGGAGGSSGGGSGTGAIGPIVTTCEHEYMVKNDNNKHWKECSKCGEKEEKSEADHTLSKATNDGGTTGTHSFECTFEGCQYKKTEQHVWGEDGKCTIADCDATNEAQAECEHDYSEVGY